MSDVALQSAPLLGSRQLLTRSMAFGYMLVYMSWGPCLYSLVGQSDIHR